MRTPEKPCIRVILLVITNEANKQSKSSSFPPPTLFCSYPGFGLPGSWWRHCWSDFSRLCRASRWYCSGPRAGSRWCGATLATGCSNGHGTPVAAVLRWWWRWCWCQRLGRRLSIAAAAAPDSSNWPSERPSRLWAVSQGNGCAKRRCNGSATRNALTLLRHNDSVTIPVHKHSPIGTAIGPGVSSLATTLNG